MTKIAVSGITHYTDPGDHRFQSCLQFLERAEAFGIPVYLADSSPRPLCDQLMERTSGTAYATGSYTEKKIRALSLALKLGAEAIVITEMEKGGLLPYLAQICAPILSGQADLVIPKRSALSWESYPSEMRVTEGFALDQIESITGRRWDTLLGAFAISRQVADLFLACQAPMWSWLHEPRFNIIRRTPGRVTEVEVNFIYPPEQKEAEEGKLHFHLKRLEQLKYTLDPLVRVYGAK